MIRRRVLGGVFKFKIDPEQMNFAYGIKKTLTEESYLYESGSVTGNPTLVTKNNKSYYKLVGRGEGLENVAFLNFKTYTTNQQVSLELIVSSESPNDFLAVCTLDSTDKNNLAVKLSGTDSTTYTFAVPTAGSHYVKIYYYQHNDGVVQNDNAGYFRLVPYYNQYEWGYDRPATQQTKVKSYYGWNLVSKPDWINLDKETDKAGTKMLTVEAQGNPGNARSGVVKLKERRGDREVELSVSQAANPHPNDILLSLESIRFPSDTGSSTVNVTLIGNTSYSISNKPTGYTITGNGTGPITVQKTGSNTNAPAFRITGNAGTVKDVIVAQDTVSCYCDCNSFNGCNCDVHTSFKHSDITTCSSEATASCPKHCSAYCSDTCSHNACICNCNQVNTCNTKCANCIGNSNAICTVDCNDTCNCYTQCSHCGGDCNAVGCTCYTQCANCGGHCSDSCNCYSVCSHCSKEKPSCWHTACSCDSKTDPKIPITSYLCEANCECIRVCVSKTSHSCGSECNSEGFTCNMKCIADTYQPGIVNDQDTWCDVHMSHCTDCNCDGQCTNDSYECTGYVSHIYYPEECPSNCGCYYVCPSEIPSCSCDCNSNMVQTDSCACNCNTKNTTTKGTCGSHCVGHNTLTKGTCGSHCVGHNKTNQDPCACDCNDDTISCSSYDACTCNTNTGNCTSHNCQSDVNTCSCNQKTYYPHCECDQFCKCDGYTNPIVS